MRYKADRVRNCATQVSFIDCPEYNSSFLLASSSSSSGASTAEGLRRDVVGIAEHDVRQAQPTDKCVVVTGSGGTDHHDLDLLVG